MADGITIPSDPAMRAFALAFVCCLPAQDSRPEAQVLFPDFGQKLEQPRAAVAADGAGEFSAPTVARAVPDIAVGLRRGPRVAVTDQAIVVSYMESRFDGKKSHGSRDLLVLRSTDRGQTWSLPKRVNSVEHSAAEGLHSLAATRGGKVGVLWLDPRGEPKGMKLWFAESKDDGASFGPDAVVYRSPSGAVCECCHPSLAYGADGLPVALWRNSLAGDRDLFVATSTPAKPLSDIKPAGQGHWKLAGCPMDGGDLALADGKPITIWRRESQVFVSRRVGEEEKLGDGEQPALAIGPRGAFAAWQEGAQLVARDLEVGSKKRVLGPGAWPVAIATGEVFAERHEGERIRLVRLGG